MSNTKPLKWGIIGCGGIAYRRTIPGIAKSEGSVLGYVMDLNPELCKKVGEDYNVSYSTKIEDVINSDVDVVYIATPVFCHKEQVIMAAKAKKHILLEKPMGLTCAEAEEIINICKENNVKLAVGFMMRYHAHHQEIKKLLESGKIGDLVSMRAQFTCWYPDMPGVWRQNKAKSGGGAVMDMATHCIDLLQYLTGTQAEEVFAMCSTQTFNYEVDDSASIMMKMAGGAHAYIDAHFNIPDDATASKLEFYGTKGSIIAIGTLSQEEVGTTTVTLAKTGQGYDAMQSRESLQSYELPGSDENLYTKEIESFADSITNDSPVIISGEEALYVQRICECAYASSDSGTKIKL